MRVGLMLLLLCVAGCGPTLSGQADALPQKDTGAAPILTEKPYEGPTGWLNLSLKGEYPDFEFPLQVRHGAGVDTVPLSGKARLALPADDKSLTRVEIQGWLPIWIRVTESSPTGLGADPCCGISFFGNEYDDEQALCASAPEGGACPAQSNAGEPECACPEGTLPVSQALAADDVCAPGTRCVRPSEVRFVKAESVSGPLVVETDAGHTYEAADDAADALYNPNIADRVNMLNIRVHRPGAKGSDRLPMASIAMDIGARYTVHMGQEGIASVTYDGPLP